MIRGTLLSIAVCAAAACSGKAGSAPQQDGSASTMDMGDLPPPGSGDDMLPPDAGGGADAGGGPGTGGSPVPMAALPAGYVYLWGDDFNDSGAQIFGRDAVTPGGTTLVAPKRWYAQQPNGQYNYGPGVNGAYVANPPGTPGYPFATDSSSAVADYLAIGNYRDSSGKLAACMLASVDSAYQGTMGAAAHVAQPGMAKHGYFEARFILPKPLPGKNNSTSGLWPAFWLESPHAGSDGYAPEMDIFEGYSVDGFASLHVTWHLWGNNNNKGDGKQFDTAGNIPAKSGLPTFADDWHTLGTLITAQTITTYLDGKVIWQTPNPDDNAYGQPMFVMLQAALGGYWPVDLSWSVPGYPGSGGDPGYWIKWDYVHVFGDPAEQ